MRVEELTFFRFLAAAIVVIFHFGRDATGLGGVLVSGPQMVSFFFVLSGFVMGVTYLNREVDRRSYWWARFARIAPVYWLAIVLMVVLSHVQGERVSPLSLVLNLALLQSWFSSHPLSVNPPGWSLSVEAFFYMSFPFLLRGIKSHELSAGKVMAGSLVVWALTQAVTIMVLSSNLYGGFPSPMHDLIFYFPPAHYCSFLLGVGGAMWFIDHQKFVIKNEAMSLLLFGSLLLLIVSLLNGLFVVPGMPGVQLALSASFYAPLFLAFIVVIGLCRSRSIGVLSARPLVLLGEASFSLYILQAPVHRIYERWIASAHRLPPLHSFTLFFVFLTLVSLVSFLALERPAMKFIRFRVPVLAKRTAEKYAERAQNNGSAM